MGGSSFPSCMVQIDVSSCVANHHYLLHGVSNCFCKYMEVREMAKLFLEIRLPDIVRLSGEINLLTAMKDAELHPRMWETSG